LLNHGFENIKANIIVQIVGSKINVTHLSTHYASITLMAGCAVSMQFKAVRFDNRQKFRECAS